MHHATAFTVAQFNDGALKGALSRERHWCRHKFVKTGAAISFDTLHKSSLLRSPNSERERESVCVLVETGRWFLFFYRYEELASASGLENQA